MHNSVNSLVRSLSLIGRLAIAMAVCESAESAESHVAHPRPFEEAYRTSGRRDVPYLAQDAFSPARLAEGKALYEEKCATCHTPSGRDMVMFGDPMFRADRVISSTRKFADVSHDPEAGEKIFEYLRHEHAGPFMYQHDGIFVPGPYRWQPGGVQNPVLDDPRDFFAAFTGHQTPTPDDADMNKLWNHWDWYFMPLPMRSLSWSEWLPHSVPRRAGTDVLNAYLATQDLRTLPVSQGYLGDQWGSVLDKSLAGLRAGNDPFIAEINEASLGAWANNRDWDYAMPRWVGGAWSRPWVYDAPTALGRQTAPWKTGHFFRQSCLRDINDRCLFNGNPRRSNGQFYYQMGWYHPIVQFMTTHKARVKPDSVQWFCMMDFNQAGAGHEPDYLSAVKELAEFWGHSKMNTGGKEEVYRLQMITQPYDMFRIVNRAEGKFCTDNATFKNLFLECMYRMWKASIGSPFDRFSGNKAQGEIAAAVSHMEPYLNSCERDFAQVFIRRVANRGGQPGTALVPFGSDTAIVGQSYVLRVLRVGSNDGDVTVRCTKKPAGAVFLDREPRDPELGYWTRDDVDYLVEWTPSPDQQGEHMFAFEADGYRTTWRVQVVDPGRYGPRIDPIPDRVAYVGQRISEVVGFENYFCDGNNVSLLSDFGKLAPSHYANGAIFFTGEIEPSDVGAHTVRLRATDRWGQTAETSFQVTVRPNHRPGVEAKATVGGQAIALDGPGPAGSRNVIHVPVGRELRIDFVTSDEDGDQIEVRKVVDFPGYVFDESWCKWNKVDYANDYLSYTPSIEMAEQFPGPNVLTLYVRDIDADYTIPGDERIRKHKSERILVFLVYFEREDSNHRPWANVEPVQMIPPASRVTLDGSGSFDVDGDPLRYRWEYDGGEPAIALTDVESPKCSFISPTEDCTLKFTLTVTDPKGYANKAVTRVRVVER